MTTTSLRPALFVALAATIVACTTPPPPSDAGSDGTGADSLIFPDVSVDGSARYAPDYRRCTANNQCDTANDEVCDLTFPGGMCRRIVCGDRTDCGNLGICSEQGCRPYCTLQSDSCTIYGGICLAFRIPFDTNTGCFAACDPNAPAASNDPEGGMRACLNMLMCDPYNGQCVSRPTTSGAVNGEPCTDDRDCRSGLCIPEVDTLSGIRPTGFLGGYCVSYGVLPRESVFAAARGMNLPTSTCPSGTVVLPAPEAAPGSAARCFKACTADAQCRAGYRCDMRGGGTDMFANGGCVPIDCAAAGAMCPAGSSCQRADADAGALFTGSRCVRNSDGGAPDASADASADANPTDSASADVGAMDAAAD
jgi:hypothetical protein